MKKNEERRMKKEEAKGRRRKKHLLNRLDSVEDCGLCWVVLLLEEVVEGACEAVVVKVDGVGIVGQQAFGGLGRRLLDPHLQRRRRRKEEEVEKEVEEEGRR